MRGGSNTQPEVIAQAIERHDPFFTSPESLALAGFLAGYSGLTRDHAFNLLIGRAVWEGCCPGRRRPLQSGHSVRAFDALPVNGNRAPKCRSGATGPLLERVIWSARSGAPQTGTL